MLNLLSSWAIARVTSGTHGLVGLQPFGFKHPSRVLVPKNNAAQIPLESLALDQNLLQLGSDRNTQTRGCVTLFA